MIRISCVLALFLICSLYSCSTNNDLEDPSSMFSYGDIRVIENPSGRVPLSLELSFETSLKSTVSVEVLGENSVPLTYDSSFETDHTLAVLGLYPGERNTIVLTVSNGISICRSWEVGLVLGKSFGMEICCLPTIKKSTAITF